MKNGGATKKRMRVGNVGVVASAVLGALAMVGCGNVEPPASVPASSADTAEATATIHAALQLTGATWIAEGPAPMTHGQADTATPGNPVTGAIHAVAPHPSDANIVYAGTVNGGVWRTLNALASSPTWTPLTDFLPSLNIGAIALDRGNPNVVIAGTGRWSSDGNDGGSQGDVLISRDSGTSWTVITDPLFAGQKLSGVVIRGNIVMAAAIDGVGLVRSVNGGTNWTRISEAAGTGLPCCGIDDLIEDRGNPSRLYATVTRVGVFRSDDLGLTWVNVSQNDTASGGLAEMMPIANAARMSTSNDGRAYVAIVSGPNLDSPVTLVEYTTDGGAHWISMELPGVGARGNPFFHFAIGADPTSSNFVYVTGVGQWMRGDASRIEGQWTSLIGQGTNFPHVDNRDLEVDANGDLIDVSDGGIFRRPNPRGTANWLSLAGNLQDGELHHIAYDQNSRIIFAGTQDNGTIFQTSRGALTWDPLLTGDGGDVAVDVLTMPGFSIRYFSTQFLGSFTRATFDANNVLISATLVALSGGGIQPQFYTPIELNRVNGRRLAIAASDAVYESFNQGDTITSLGGPFARAMFYGHPLNADVLWVAGNGQILRRLSGTGPLVATPAPLPSGDDRDVVADPADFRRAYIAAGFDGVFLTPDGGSSWTNITGNLGSFDARAVRTIEFIPSSPQSAVVVGTERGVFATPTNALGTWQEIGRLPHAPVNDMEYNRRDDLLVVGMMGRGSFTAQGIGGANQPPVARCRDVAVDAAAASCRGTVTAADVNAGTTDPDNDPFTCVLLPGGPFVVGTTSVTLSCTDNRGGTATCSATVAVGPGDSRACCPAGTNVIVGTSNNDTLNGTAGRDCIIGLGGQDTINGFGGDDIISAGDGTDIVFGGLGNDLIFGGPGQDQLHGDAGDDIVAGGEGDDRCFGGDGADRLFGGNGQDQLSGDAGNDRLFGNDGDDNLSGGDGDDLLDGGGLHDVCIGGPGTDTFFMCQTQTQ